MAAARLAYFSRELSQRRLAVALAFIAVDCSLLNQISFGDALVIVCAESARCTLVLSEDLNDGQVIKGVQVQNPVTWNERS